jgi:hypothetical protein
MHCQTSNTYCKIIVPPSLYSILEVETLGSSEPFVTTCGAIRYKFSRLQHKNFTDAKTDNFA